MQYRSVLSAGLAIAMSALTLTACGEDEPTSNGTGTGGGGGGGAKTVTISTDLPMQGSSKDTSEATVNMIKLYLESIGNKAGDHTVQLKVYDDSTAAKGAWDQAQCTANANQHVYTAGEVAVMGTYNSGCAKLEAPILNSAPDGPMLMVSHANTGVGLTKSGAGAEADEPKKYQPSGKPSYARVIATDEFQGKLGAQFAKDELKVTKCLVLNDNETYGKGVAKFFADAFKEAGGQVVAEEAWNKASTSYESLYRQHQSKAPDCVYVGGIFDNNGGQLVKDKVSVLGDNTKVKLLGPDGFTGYPDLNKMPEAQGMYLSTPALPASEIKTGPATKLIADYKAKYPNASLPNYALYGVAAVQVILEAIAKSDGTRKGVRDAVFEGEGITISADKSILGKEFKIDPKTGDISFNTMTFELIKGNQETFFKGLTL